MASWMYNSLAYTKLPSIDLVAVDREPHIYIVYYTYASRPYLFYSLINRNWHQPTLVISLLLLRQQELWSGPGSPQAWLNSRQHKTASSYGPASLVPERTDAAALFKKFLTKTRPWVVDNLIINGFCARDQQRAATHLLQRPCDCPLPAGTFANTNSNEEGGCFVGCPTLAMEEISKHMTHSTWNDESRLIM